MIPIDTLRKVTHLVTHENCSDGMASAMIIKNALPNVRVTFVNYDTPAYKALVAEPGMLFCDVTPAKDRVQEFVDAGALCLDHHKKAEDIVLAFGENGVFADEKKDPGVSGAVLAYRHVWLPLSSQLDFVSLDDDYRIRTTNQVGNFASLIGIRDTWQRTHGQWEKACQTTEGLAFWPEEELLGLPPSKWEERADIGRIVYPRKLKGAVKATEGAKYFTSISGTKVCVFAGVRASSDASDYLGKEIDITAGFATFVEDGKLSVQFSCRSKAGYDVSSLAAFYGGGGHTAAAGFKVLLDRTEEEKKVGIWDAFRAAFFSYVPKGFKLIPERQVHPFMLFESLLNEYEAARAQKILRVSRST